MNAVIRLAVIPCLLVSASAGAQQGRALDHDAWDTWRRIREQQLSPDGQWISYALTVSNGDPTLMIHGLDSGSAFAIPRGGAAEFSADSRYAAFLIKPQDSIVKAMRIEKTKPADLPKDSLGIIDLRTGEISRVARVQSFAMPEDGAGWIAFLHHEEDGDERPDRPDEEEDEDDEESKKEKDPGTELVLRSLRSGDSTSFEFVTSYAMADAGDQLAFARSTPDGTGDGVLVVRPGSEDVRAVLEGEGNYKHLTFAGDGTQLAFLTDRDDFDADQSAYTLYRSREGDPAIALAVEGTDGIPAGWWVSENGELSYSDNGERLFFGTAPRPEPDPDDVPEWEQVNVDVWNWRDPLLQPMQLVQRDRELRRTFRAVAHLDDGGRVVQLADRAVPTVTVAEDGNGAIAFAASNTAYQQEISWDSPRYVDVWVVDVNSGDRRRAISGLQASPRMSPDGRYVSWWDGNDRAWHGIATAGGDPINLSSGVPEPLYNELHDWPYIMGSYGSPGWTDDNRLLVYDKHDIWALDPSGRDAPQNVTDGVGRRENLRFRYLRTDPEQDAVPASSDIHLSVLDYGSKDGGVYLERIDRNRAPRRLVMSAHRFAGLRKAEDADVFLYTRQSFREFPDLWVADASLGSPTRVSDANPQQADYRWGTTELVGWRSNDGRQHDGILYKPDGFDANRQYPMLVYFYEKNSDGLNLHKAPFVGGSSINISFYVSRGYVVFVPDVHYRVGYPGESAVNSVVSGVLDILEDGYVDPARVGVQGHSWGGYQIAYMVTKTHVFAAAEAGAPVANMTSAYGGIRWASGMSRAFQYEKTQSRIGATLWERRDRYIENSPLFWADNVHTPVLMMHNDEDGAVPWYQGIEFFSALRRLGRPVWMLNYNGEAHGLRKHQNRKDWQVRMQQFFDHYLVGSPPPVWMEEGVPAVAKGRATGLELMTAPVTSSTGNGNRDWQ